MTQVVHPFNMKLYRFFYSQNVVPFLYPHLMSISIISWK
uniref:Uncharacterized protein n=1 Tax=Manihot esculenta TaxID=3983 RepID=A0A2C9V7W9_MANES